MIRFPVRVLGEERMWLRVPAKADPVWCNIVSESSYALSSVAQAIKKSRRMVCLSSGWKLDIFDELFKASRQMQPAWELTVLSQWKIAVFWFISRRARIQLDTHRETQLRSFRPDMDTGIVPEKKR